MELRGMEDDGLLLEKRGRNTIAESRNNSGAWGAEGD